MKTEGTNTYTEHTGKAENSMYIISLLTAQHWFLFIQRV